MGDTIPLPDGGAIKIVRGYIAFVVDYKGIHFEFSSNERNGAGYILLEVDNKPDTYCLMKDGTMATLYGGIGYEEEATSTQDFYDKVSKWCDERLVEIADNILDSRRRLHEFKKEEIAKRMSVWQDKEE